MCEMERQGERECVCVWMCVNILVAPSTVWKVKESNLFNSNLKRN